MLPRKHNIFKKDNFCLVAECDSVSKNTEEEKPLLFLLQNR